MKNTIKFLFAVSLVAICMTRPATAAILFYNDFAAYQAQLATLSLVETNSVNFDSMPTGTMGMNFTEGGINFAGNVPSRITAGTTSSPANFLGFDDPQFPDYQPGDEITITLPANSRGMRLNIITETIPDILNSAMLTAASSSVNTVAGGTTLDGNFKSYFLGVINDSGTISNGVVSFPGQAGIAFYRIDDVAVAGISTIPEPSSMALVGAAMLLGVSRRRRSRE